MKYKFDIKKIVLVSLIYCSLDVMWMIYNSYVPIYLQAGNPSFAAGVGILGFGFGPALTGFLMTLDNIAALFLSPFIGMLSDCSKSKMGRRMPFIVFSMPFMVAALFLIPIFPQMIPAALSGKTAELTRWLVPFMASLVVLLLANAVMFGPGRVLLFDITPSEHRTTANGICNVLDGILAIVVILGGAALYEMYHPLPMWIAGIFILIGVLLAWALIKEPQVTDSSASEMETTPKQILNVITHLPKDYARSTIFYILTLFFAYLGLSLGQAFVTSYAVSVLKAEISTASLLLAILMIVALVMAVPAALLANCFGRKRMMVVGSIICALVCVFLFIVSTLTATMIAIGVFGLGWILANISQSPMMVDHSPSEKYLGTYMSMIFITMTVAMIIGPIFGGWLVQRFNNNYNVIWPVMAAFFAISAFTLIPVTKGEAKKSVVETRSEAVLADLEVAND
jgi:maltose/moltooligosaccharide transporter